MRAVEINDLVGKNEADDVPWDALKASQICAERQTSVRDARTRYRIDYCIPYARGRLGVALGGEPRRLPKGKGWRVLQFSGEDVYARQADCVRKVKRAARELGDLKYWGVTT